MDKVRVGQIINTHGIKGEVKVKSFTDFEDLRFKKGNTVYLDDEILEIHSFRIHKGFVLLTFKGYQNINDVEKWKGKELFVSIDDLHELEENENYYYELSDCNVYDEEAHLLGTVSELIETPAHLILRVSSADKKDLLIPFVEQFILDVDSDEKKIIVRVLEGM